jgi:hypothetical protein
VPLEKHVPGCGYLVRFECPDCQHWIPKQEHHPNCDYVGLVITHEEMTDYRRTWGRTASYPGPEKYILDLKLYRRRNGAA